MTLVEIVIALGLIMGLSLGVMVLLDRTNKVASSGTLKASAQEIRRNLLAMLENESVWLQVFAHEQNRTFECVRKRLDCHQSHVEGDDAKPGLPYVVYDSAGQVYFDSRNPTAGYTQGGAPCTSYPSRGCPLRPELTWRPVCTAAETQPCFPQQLELSGRVFYNPGPDAPRGTVIAYNAENYAFRLIKNVLAAPQQPQQTAAVVPATPAEADGEDGRDDSEKLAQKQKDMLCNQVAPTLRGQSPEALKQTMRGMGYEESTFDELVKALENCPKP